MRGILAEQGVAAASLGDIARRAGVGPGTLWRHFAGRDALVAEVVGQSLDDLAASARRYVPPPPPTVRWGAAASRSKDAAADLVGRALSAGDVHPDLTAATLVQLCTALAWTHEQASARSVRSDLATLVRMTFHGLLTDVGGERHREAGREPARG